MPAQLDPSLRVVCASGGLCCTRCRAHARLPIKSIANSNPAKNQPPKATSFQKSRRFDMPMKSRSSCAWAASLPARSSVSRPQWTRCSCSMPRVASQFWQPTALSGIWDTSTRRQFCAGTTRVRTSCTSASLYDIWYAYLCQRESLPNRSRCTIPPHQQHCFSVAHGQ